MNFPGRPVYQGDKVFAQLLDELNCDMELHGIKAYLAGASAATHLVSLDQHFATLWVEEDPTFASQEQAQQFVTNLLGLMNEVSPPGGYRLSSADGLVGPEGVTQLSIRRFGELSAFLYGFDLGTKPQDALPEGAKEGTGLIAQIQALYEPFLEPDDRPEEAHAQEVLDHLLGFDQALEEAIALTQAAQRQARAQAFRDARPKPPGRNDPCPCGSGLKYKRCCGK